VCLAKISQAMQPSRQTLTKRTLNTIRSRARSIVQLQQARQLVDQFEQRTTLIICCQPVWRGPASSLHSKEVHVICLDLSRSAGDKAEAKKDAAVVAADDSRKAPANKRTNKKGVAAARKAAADKVTEVEKSPVSAAGKPDAKQKSSALDVVDLLTPVDLIKKSSANRAKQKQAPAQSQQPTAAEAAPFDPAESEPAGKKVATRGRNANLQVVEVEPKAKCGKRKTASETTDKLTADVTAAQAPASHEQDQEYFLPNRKRARPSKSLPHKAAATVDPDKAVVELQQPEAGATALREVPGLPGVKHQMPKIAIATAATKDAKPAQLAAAAAASESRSQSGPARSNNSRKQASSGKAGTSKAAATGETTKPDTVPAPQPGSAEGEVAVDKPADRAVAVAMQPTLASAGFPQGMQFHKLQVWRHLSTCTELLVQMIAPSCVSVSMCLAAWVSQ